MNKRYIANLFIGLLLGVTYLLLAKTLRMNIEHTLFILIGILFITKKDQ